MSVLRRNFVMGLRFRKSIKLGKHTRLNLNKKSFGVSFGGKGARFTLNSKGRRTALSVYLERGYHIPLHQEARRSHVQSQKQKVEKFVVVPQVQLSQVAA
jgi:hypothetical protein